MNTVMVIAAREIRERSRLFIVGAALALVPFAAALVPAASSQRGLAIMTVGLTLSVVYGLTLALGIGATTVSRDLRDKRLSFYFSKPISPVSLWIGKSSAAVLVAVVCMAIVAVPTIVVAFNAWWGFWMSNGPALALVPCGAVVAVFLVSHVMATMVRSRSVLIALDFVLAVVMAGALVLILRPVLVASLWRFGWVFRSLLAAITALSLVILAVAPVWQLAKGRTDARRSHLALSRFLWFAVAVLLLAAGAYVLWLGAVTPATLDEVSFVQQAPRGGWALVSGAGKYRGDFVSTFLVNTVTGDFTKAQPWSEIAWSRDGRVMVFSQPASFIPDGRVELFTRRVGSNETRTTGIVTREGWGRFVLSDDGSRLALLADLIVSVHDLRTHRLLSSVAGVYDARMFFVTPDVIRIIQRQYLEKGLETLSVKDLDLRTRTVTLRGKRAVPRSTNRNSVSEDGSRMYVHATGEIVDGSTLAAIATIGRGTEDSRGSKMLNDGTVVFVDPTNGVRLRMFDRDGAACGEVALPSVARAGVLGETSDGKVIVEGWSGKDPNITSTTFLIDRSRGAIVRAEPELGGPGYWSLDPRTTRYEVGPPFVGVTKAGKLKIWSAKS